jgi:hypothetical protein
MSLDRTNELDYVGINYASGDLWLTTTDPLPWDEDEGHHLYLLQDKMNAYLAFIEGGDVFQKFPEAEGRRIVINLVGRFPLSAKAHTFLELAKTAVEEAGVSLQFSLHSD